MLTRVNNHHLLAVGLTKARIKDPEKTLSTLRKNIPYAEVQVVRADRVAGQEHLIFATRNTLKASEQGHLMSKTVAMELLLYLSSQRQISKAIQTLGVNNETEDLVILVLSQIRPDEVKIERLLITAFGGRRDDIVIEIRSNKKARGLRSTYGITSRELEAARMPRESGESVLKRLVIERSALLSLET